MRRRARKAPPRPTQEVGLSKRGERRRRRTCTELARSRLEPTTCLDGRPTKRDEHSLERSNAALAVERRAELAAAGALAFTMQTRAGIPVARVLPRKDASSSLATTALIPAAPQTDFRAIFEAVPGRYLALAPDERFTILDASDDYLKAANTSRDHVLGHGLFEVLPLEAAEPEAPGVRSLFASLDRIVRTHAGDSTPVEKYRIRRPEEEGGGFEPRWWSSTSSPVLGEHGELLYIIHRIDDADTRIEELAAAGKAVADAVAGMPSASVRTVLETIAMQARSMTHAEYASLGIGTDPEKPFDLWVFVGMSREQADAIGHPPRPVGVLSIIAREGRTLRIRDVRRHPASRPMPRHHPEIRSFLGVPIRFRGRQVGSLYLGNKREAEEFTESDERLVEMLAARVGVAIETARLYHETGMEGAWLKAVVDQMPEGIVLMDAKGHITMNLSMLELSSGDTGQQDPFGNSILFDVRRPSGQRVPPDQHPNVTALRGQITRSEELRFYRKDGRGIPVLVSAKPVRDSDDAIVGATMFVQDISTLKELERRREEWASVVAHDLKQPVNTISIGAQLLAQRCRDRPEVLKTIDHIQTAAGRLTHMIDDLMDASLLEARSMKIAPADIDLGQLVRQIVERSGHEPTEIRVSGDLRPVRADPHRVEQVLANLISNAAKYGDPGYPLVIDVRSDADEAEVTVTNRGRGIAADEIPRLFDRFFRATAARRSGQVGLGLGLYVAKGLVESHGGRMWVDSTPNETTSFHFTLPLSASSKVRA